MRSILVPFNFSGGGVSVTRNQDTIIRQKIVDVLTTSAPERFGLPNYGADIYSLLFQPIDELVEADFKTDAIIALQERVRGVTIHDVRLKQHELEESTVEVYVYYSLPLGSTQTFSFTVTSQLTEESPL